MKLIDVIGIALIIVGIMMTAVNFLAYRHPSSDVLDFSIQEIAPVPVPHGKPIAFFTTATQSQVPPTPYRMGDWAECRDGQQFYIPRSMAEPCLEHGGLRGYGPGKRLDEK